MDPQRQRRRNNNATTTQHDDTTRRERDGESRCKTDEGIEEASEVYKGVEGTEEGFQSKAVQFRLSSLSRRTEHASACQRPASSSGDCSSQGKESFIQGEEGTWPLEGKP